MGCPTSHHAFRVSLTDFGLQPHIKETYQIKSIHPKKLMATWTVIPGYAEYEWVSHVHSVLACDVEPGSFRMTPAPQAGIQWVLGEWAPQQETIVCRTRSSTESPETMNVTVSSKLLTMPTVIKDGFLYLHFYFSFLIVIFFRNTHCLWYDRKNTTF